MGDDQVLVHLVSGAPRSGTTLLQAILSSASRANPLLGEAGFLCHLLEFYREVDGIWEDDARYYFRSRDQVAVIARRAFSEVLRGVAADHDCQNVVIKSPRYSRYAKELRVIMPRARCYIMMRDPKDVIALQWEASVRELSQGYRPTMLQDAGETDVRIPLLSEGIVASLARQFLKAYPIDSLTTWVAVRYENLVRNPAPALEALAQVSGLEITFDPEAAWPDGPFNYLRHSTTKELAWSSALWGAPISESRVGAYQEILPGQYSELIDEICKDYLTIMNSLPAIGLLA